MFKNSLKIAWRNLVKDRQFTFLNLLGLSTGLACALMIYLWVSDEMNVDKFNEKDNRLYQVMKNSKESDGSTATYEWTPGLLAQALAEEMPEVEKAVTVVPPYDGGKGILSAADKHIRAIAQYAGKDYFDIFSFPIISGDKNQVLKEKNAIAISDELAKKIFNTTENLIGKSIEWTQDEINGTFQISAIFKKPPRNATAQFDVVLTFELYREKYKYVDAWTYGGPSTYIILKKGTDADQFNKKAGSFLQQKSKEDYQSLFIRKYSNQYLYGKYENGVRSGGRIEYVKLFSIIAFFILIIACINFMNLSTAKASKRMKEVGIKKVVGAGRGSLIFQYIGESMLMVFLSLLIAIALVVLFLPAFKEITGKNISLQFDANVVFSVIGITFITGLVAGSYPALYLSGFRPALILKGKLKTSSSESWLRKGLVVFQFAVSVILIVSVIVVYKQMGFVRSNNLGFNKDNVIVFKRDGKLNDRIQPFLHGLKNIPGIVNASLFGSDLITNFSGTKDILWEGKSQNDNNEFKYLFVGNDFIETLGIKIKEGRAFSEKFGSDSSKIIFNEAAVEAMGLKNPVGKIITQWNEKKQIVGVVKNFHFESLYEKVKPCFIILSPGKDNNMVMAKIKAGTETATITRVAEFYKQFNQGLPFEYKFLDDDYQALYASEQRVAVLSKYFAAIAILISCLGLFGLAAFTAQRRQKEIGIRKVVGASVSGIAAMLSVDFLKLVLIALLIAIPVSWWAANQWLQSFAYRININAGIFLITGAAVVSITLLTISFQTIKAAVANPVKSLRTE